MAKRTLKQDQERGARRTAKISAKHERLRRFHERRLTLVKGAEVCLTTDRLGHSYQGTIGTIVKVLTGKRAGHAIIALTRYGKVEKRVCPLDELTFLSPTRKTDDETLTGKPVKKKSTPAPTQKKATKPAPVAVSTLIKALTAARKKGDTAAARKLRRQLRKAGHKGGLRK